LDAFRDEDKQVRRPWGAEDMGSIRYTGGHLHVGCNPWPEWLPKRAFVQFLATAYGAYIPELHPSGRDRYYGMPGIWRETPYGVEYRTPTIAWLRKEYPYLDAMEKSIKRMLTAKDDEVIEGLARIYQQGTLAEFRYAFDKKNYGHATRLANNVDVELTEVFSGKRYKVKKPAKLVLEGYRREPEHDQGVAQEIGAARHELYEMDAIREAAYHAPRRAMGVLPIFERYGGNLVANGGAVETARMRQIWSWVLENYPGRMIKYATIDYLGEIEEGQFENYHQFRTPPHHAGQRDPETLIVIASGDGTPIKIYEEVTNNVLYDILGMERDGGDVQWDAGEVDNG
jgi:hypothetical protein